MSGSFVEVDTTNGRMLGIRYHGVAEFLGIPYGASTAEARRFAPPVAPEKWGGVRDTMSFGDASPQLDALCQTQGACWMCVRTCIPRADIRWMACE
jgi:carboxylesterase type B